MMSRFGIGLFDDVFFKQRWVPIHADRKAGKEGHTMPRSEWIKIAAATCTVILVGCSSPNETPSSTSSSSSGSSTSGGQVLPDNPNVLLVIADDFGVDASVCYSVGTKLGKAPRIKELCDRGVVFDNAWATPTCSPTRATILTGRHGFRTGIGTQIIGNMSTALSLDEFTLPRAIEAGNPGTYASACIGKWHLSNSSNGGANHPNIAGFPHYAGSWEGALPDYFAWPRTVDGVTANIAEYATTVQVNDARDFINQQTGSWFVWLALNAPHSPFHLPPLDLHTYDYLDGQPLPMRPVEHYQAMIEAMDTELGRLLDSLPANTLENTWIIFIGDNGTPRAVVEDPALAPHAKDSLYQGGIHVPLFVVGPGIVQGGRRVSALVHSVDIFSTILDLAGIDKVKALPAGLKIDSVSLKPYLENPDQQPLRSWAFTELFGSATMVDENGKTIRDEAFKLIRYEDGHSALYDLRTDPKETTDLIAAGALSTEATMHRQTLESAMDTLLASK